MEQFEGVVEGAVEDVAVVGFEGCCRQASTLFMCAASMCFTALAVAEVSGSVGRGFDCVAEAVDNAVAVAAAGVMLVFFAGVSGKVVASEVVAGVAVVVVVGDALAVLAGGAGGLGVCSKGGSFCALVAPDNAENTPCQGWLERMFIGGGVMGGRKGLVSRAIYHTC